MKYVHHEGTPLDMFHSNFMMDPYYNWNPPIRTSLTAVGINDTDDYQINLDDNDHGTHEDEPIPSGTFGGGDHTCNGMELCSLHGDPIHHDCRCTNQTFPMTEGRHISVVSQTMTPPDVEFHNGAMVPLYLIPSNTSKSTQLTLDQFENNYRLFSQRLKNDDDNLTVRVITLKNNPMFLNFTCKILGTTNVIEAILASTYIMCSKLLEHLSKGDTFLCSLEAGYLTIHNSIIRNKHVYNLVDILNQIKNKTGLYTIMEGSKYDWLEYASNDTTNIELVVTPKKDVINQTIMTFLNGLWATKWENLKGHAQTKYWCMGPDPILAAKLLNMPREHLGWCIQFFTGHGWWKKHLKLANLCNDHTCRLCKHYNSVESPIHLFSECTELTAIRQELFNNPYPTNLSISNQLCQVAEFALVEM